MAIPGQKYIDLNRSATVHPLMLGAGVPQGRVITTTFPLLIDGGASADLSSNRTISLTTNPAGQIPVGVTRLITGTSPVTINGGASHDLSADITIAVPSFAGTTPGLVPIGTSDGTKFLSQLGWAAGTVVGVSSLAGTAPIFVSGATGAVTISIAAANLLTPGYVPAVGSTSPQKFLTNTNPPTWAIVPGSVPGVTLQGSTPGAADTGNAHISGVFIADQRVVGGSIAVPVGFAPLESYNNVSTSFGLFIEAAGAPTHTTEILQRTARGSISAPTSTQDTDVLGGIVASGYGNAFTGSFAGGVIMRADGNPVSNRQIMLTDMMAGDISNFAMARLSQSGLLIKNALSSLTSSDRAASSVDVYGSLGLRNQAQTTSFSTDDVTVGYFCDATGGQINVTLLTGSGRPGRVHTFKKVDTSGNHVLITPASGSVEGVGSYELIATDEYVTLWCDGTNWWVVGQNRSITHQTEYAVAETHNSFTGPLTWSAGINLVSNRRYTNGGRFKLVLRGTVHCTGTPTLDLWIWHNGTLVSKTGAITLAANLNNRNWRYSCDAVFGTGGTTLDCIDADFKVASADSTTPMPMATYSPDMNSPITFSAGSPFQLIATFSAANSANSVTWSTFTIEYVPAGFHD